MITVFIVNLLVLLITTFKIKKKCGSWENFDSSEYGFGMYMIFNVSFWIMVLYVVSVIVILIVNGIIP